MLMHAHGPPLLQSKKFDEAAKQFARSTAPFEEVALMFLDSQQVKPLTKYLTLKLDSLSPGVSAALDSDMSGLMNIT